MSELVINLDESTGAQSGDAPLTLVLHASAFSVADGPIVKIEYDFGDGTDPTVIRKRLSVDSTELSAFPYPADPGDPRNVTVTHTLFPSVTADPQIFDLIVRVTKATDFVAVEYTIPISVNKVDAINGLADGYFEDIHLIGMRMHGQHNIKTMLFETKNPRYLTVTTYNDIINGVVIPLPTPTPTPTPTSTPSTSCAYVLPSVPVHTAAVVDLSELAGFVGGSYPAFSDLYSIGAVMSEDARVAAVNVSTTSYMFTRDGDTFNFSISTVNPGTQNADEFFGIDRNYTIVGETHNELGG